MEVLLVALVASITAIVGTLRDLSRSGSRDVLPLALTFTGIVLAASSTFAFLAPEAAAMTLWAVPVGFALIWSRLDRLLASRVQAVDLLLEDPDAEEGSRLLALHDRTDEVEAYSTGWGRGLFAGVVSLLIFGYGLRGVEEGLALVDGLITLLGASVVVYPFARAARSYLEDRELRHLKRLLSEGEGEGARAPLPLPEDFPEAP